MRNHPVIGILLLTLTFLACGPLDRLQTLNRRQQAAATGAALIGQNSRPVAEAYNRLQNLPGYRLEQRVTTRSNGYRFNQVIVSEYDAGGNFYMRVQDTENRPQEFYYVAGHTYLFDPQYSGWVDAGTGTPAALQQIQGKAGAAITQVKLLSQIGAIPVKAGQDTVQNRPAARYRLEHIVTQMAELFDGRPANSPVDLRGMLWIDDETGALLKLELLLYEDTTSQPVQEFLLETSQIGQIEPITAPSPLVNPQAIAAATATAQAWTVLTVNLNFQNEPVSFELIPVQVKRVTNVSPRRAEVTLILRKLPGAFFASNALEQFLARLRQQLTLSIPKRNLVVTSSGLHLLESSPADRTVKVVYYFNADLEDFAHAELIIAGEGNPLFAPVPVKETNP